MLSFLFHTGTTVAAIAVKKKNHKKTNKQTKTTPKKTTTKITFYATIAIVNFFLMVNVRMKQVRALYKKKHTCTCNIRIDGLHIFYNRYV